MTSKTSNRRFRLSPATLISCLALFLALTGSAFAVGVAKNSVRSAQIVDGTVRTVDLGTNAVKAGKVAPNAIGAPQIAENAISSTKVEDESLTAADLGGASVGTSEIADGAVSSADVANQSLTSDDLAPDSVRASELGTVVQRQGTAEAIAAGANKSTSVSCQAGEQVLGGGGQPANFGVEMTSSRPSGNGWLYQARNETGGASTITAYVLCLAN